MPNLSPVCQKIQNQIDALKSEKTSLQADLQDASPGQKSALVNQIKALTTKITAKQKELAECVKKNPYVPPKPSDDPCKNKCLDLKKKLDKLLSDLRKQVQAALAPLQAELHEASPGQKPFIIQQIRQTREQIEKNSPTAKKAAEARKAYNDCVVGCGGKLALNATFKGTVTVTTSNSDAPGPFKQSVTIGLRFSDWDHAEITITNFPAIVVGPYDTPIGDVTTTVSFIGGGGTFNPKTKKIDLSLSLYFNHSASDVLAGDSRLDIQLHTTSALDAKGKIKLEGSSKFKDGFLGGDTCWMTVDGTVSPQP